MEFNKANDNFIQLFDEKLSELKDVKKQSKESLKKIFNLQSKASTSKSEPSTSVLSQLWTTQNTIAAIYSASSSATSVESVMKCPKQVEINNKIKIVYNDITGLYLRDKANMLTLDEREKLKAIEKEKASLKNR